jgi:hypothetical protein
MLLRIIIPTVVQSLPFGPKVHTGERKSRIAERIMLMRSQMYQGGPIRTNLIAMLKICS